MDQKDVERVIKYTLTGILISPVRLVDEVSSKLLYVGWHGVRKILLTAIGIDLLMLVINIFKYKITSVKKLIEGNVSTIMLLISLCILLFLMYYLYEKGTYITDEYLMCDRGSEILTNNKVSYKEQMKRKAKEDTIEEVDVITAEDKMDAPGQFSAFQQSGVEKERPPMAVRDVQPVSKESSINDKLDELGALISKQRRQSFGIEIKTNDNNCDFEDAY